MKLIIVLSFLSCFLLNNANGSFVTPKKDLWERHATSGCAYYLKKKLTWSYSEADVMCSYQPAFGTWISCIYDTLQDLDFRDNNVTFDKTLMEVRSTCQRQDEKFKDFSLSSYYEALNNATKYIQNSTDGLKDLTYPVSVDKFSRFAYSNAYHAFAHNLDASNRYGVLLYVYFAIVFVIAGLCNFLDHSGINVKIFKRRLIQKIRGKIMIPTLFGYHADYVGFNKVVIGLVPSRLESTILFGYSLLHLIFLSKNYVTDNHNIFYKTKLIQYLKLIADRAGILAFAHFPLIVLFSTRNNLIELLTDFKYTTFVAFHKWIGRTMVIDAMVHSLCYLLQVILTNALGYAIRARFFQFGIFATCVATCIVIFSFGYFRLYYYETFLYGHIILAILFFYSCWKHVERFGWKEWVISSIFLWIAERLLRIFRLVIFGFPKAKLKLIDIDLVKVTIKKHDIRYWSMRPGQYAFAYFMSPVIFWQSHPFTVLDDGNELIIVLRVKKGATSHLFKKLIANNGAIEMRVSLEGPYGSSAPVYHSDDILLLAGGSGVPGPLAHLINLVNENKLDLVQSKKSIKFVIATRGKKILQAYQNEIMKLKDVGLDIELYVTNAPISVDENDSINPVDFHDTVSTCIPLLEESDILEKFKQFMTIKRGRPDIEAILEKSIRQGKSLSVLCCGAPLFVDVTRDMTAMKILQHPDSAISYYEEFQCW
ncbi:hypothetical protein KAFR_0C00190 [Kazachstania africana CBS 2517]|uniref:FAD-binding FR-type domain-containing protein n=1 Tax=Kazachstania africana (strain ATCC 22294 / BCRC 22015 / CBS 2517 / CECT 1963 / NBRC 1671 / NRRL Y-8276) TaxID=1071382 RepID=H2ARL5_KAZAF|nr:hypothetical protein KAFR_0C00190 [Kazachstania africana CBS 2517]CCF57015.1 hypothetical protein KAFR_0C00190 [Kazachstania africana CBS 2517]